MKTNNELPSKRKFAVAFIEGASTVTNFPTLAEILYDDSEEWKYAVQENLDALLDLKVGDRLHMAFNRDNPDDSQGYIKRTI